MLLNGKAILFCGTRMCFALTFCGEISFCYLERRRKESGLPRVTGKTSAIPHHPWPSKPMQRIAPAASPGALFTANCPAKLEAGACRAGHSFAHPPGAALQAGTLQAPRDTLQSPFAQRSWEVNVLLSSPARACAGKRQGTRTPQTLLLLNGRDKTRGPGM